ncbi:LacI family DNA-binding transcriptional regulator [Pseudonocardia sp. MH-G8]|uniref:LacI family DNA-binding transcriptional regulator n=1 Tax=Pseudonocardia sp. MH-G8 TaxID=1854588 RepID=UPI000BA05163|nr:LacI family DNA-binding transcriptional regulator [Pseudonocardia sp. MH-G8]OZM79718.1 LacI family transcriptional regulator [Pseudonocardia sp. MH-G8]
MAGTDDGRRAPITLEDVARAAGVSRATASRALTGSDVVSTPARERARAVAASLGYTPDRLARALAAGTGSRLVVAVAGPDPAVLDDAYTGQVVNAAAAVGDGAGVGVSLQWLPLYGLAELERIGADRSVHGLVLVNATHGLLARVPRSLRGRAVSIGVGSRDVPAVDIDNAGGAAALVTHLIGTGRRRIAMVTGPRWLPCSERMVETYRAVLADAGLPARVVSGGFAAEDGLSGARHALHRWPDTDAVLAVCDAVALGAIAALRELGVQVPGDVAVAGFDDVPMAAWGFPALTTATHPVRAIATAAATAVLGGGAGPPQTWYRSELVLRASA